MSEHSHSIDRKRKPASPAVRKRRLGTSALVALTVATGARAAANSRHSAAAENSGETPVFVVTDTPGLLINEIAKDAVADDEDIRGMEDKL